MSSEQQTNIEEGIQTHGGAEEPQGVAKKIKPTLVKTDEDALIRAIEKWVRFQQSMWTYIHDELERPIWKTYQFGVFFRVIIIGLSAAITTISTFQDDLEVWVIPVMAGTLTALTAYEAFFKFMERRSEMMQQQRELQAKRDELRYKWMVDVELNTDMGERMKRALDLLEDGPKAYNEILNKYAFESKEAGQGPSTT